ncbi:MAG: 50S ribosomal protein L4 [Candidatus Woesearchaeota archaeon]|nr:50S ribosomal protein L4 [Candidatus Woesearchaeota archaeon]
MKLEVLSISKTSIGKKELPMQFYEQLRPDLVKRAVEALQLNRRQPYGAKPTAGKRHAVEISKRRRDYKTCYGHGISRIPRKVLARRGSQMFWVGAFAPGTVGGRRAHPPKAEKIWERKINKKENRKAIRSAIAATIVKNIVEKRGHIVPNNYPFIVESKIESINKTKAARTILERLGFKEELERTEKKKVRAGKGKLRGRMYRKKKGLLIVVSKDCPLIYSAKNIPGVDVVEVRGLNAEILAPGANIGRMTIFTEAAIDILGKEGLFTNDYKGPKTQKGVQKEEFQQSVKDVIEENKKEGKKKKAKEGRIQKRKQVKGNV